MIFTEALKELMKGKKVRRVIWQKGHYWKLQKDGSIVQSDGKSVNDFEVLEEKE